MRRLLNILIILIVCGLTAAPVWAVPTPGLTITASPFPLVVNQLARITISAFNPGGAVDNVAITSGLPNNMSIEAVGASQGGVSVYNSAVLVRVGRLETNQTVTVTIDVAVVDFYPSDAPFNLCAGMTYTNGVARLSCLPNQPAVKPGSRPTGQLPANGQRPISDPNRPPVFLPVSGIVLEPPSVLLIVSGLALIALTGRKRLRKRQ